MRFVSRETQRISIHALRKESDDYASNATDTQYISIHALRKESDQPFLASHVIDGEISIHALRKESDAVEYRIGDTVKPFQSTLSVRRATGGMACTSWPICISIHALRKESDWCDGLHGQ